jgi:hypothetical protein
MEQTWADLNPLCDILMKMGLAFRALSVKELDGTFLQLTANKSRCKI